MRGHVRRDHRKLAWQLGFGSQYAVDALGKALEGLARIVRPVGRQAVIEEQVYQNAGIAASFAGEAAFGLQDQRMTVGEGVDLAMQADAGFDLGRPATL